MDPAIPDINISDVVVSKAGHDQDKWFYVIGEDQDFLLLTNGKAPAERAVWWKKKN